MARPTVIRTEQILEAARTVFLERGVSATSAEVAQRAGVSEGSIFKRFKTKSELFQAAMGMDLEDLPRGLEVLPSLAGRATVEENLVAAGLQSIGFFERLMPLMMMRWANPKTQCLTAGLEGQAEPPPIRAQRYIAEYLQHEIELGRLRQVDTHTIARAFMGALSTYVFSELLASGLETGHIEPRTYVEGYVQTLLCGMEAGSTRLRTVRRPAASAEGETFHSQA
jgi:AcrR family transcriptional regulator